MKPLNPVIKPAVSFPATSRGSFNPRSDGGGVSVLQQAAAAEGRFALLGPLSVRSQVDDLTAVQAAGVLPGVAASCRVEHPCERKGESD